MLFRLLFFVVLALCSGCSLFGRDDLETPEEKMAVLRVANDYLRFVAGGNVVLAEGIVAWSDYGPAIDDDVHRGVFGELIRSHLKRWTVSQHPLLGLDVQEISVHGDDAKVVLQKKESDLKVRLKLRWAGRGWLVVDDNIFAKDGIYRE